MESRIYRLALEDLLAASALQRADPQTKTLLRLGKCQLALGLILPAQTTLDQAFKLNPSNVPLQNERAKAARIANHVANVKREIENKNWSMVLLGVDAASREIEETPREWKTWKVQALVGKKRYDEAAGMAASVTTIYPSHRLIVADLSRPTGTYSGTTRVTPRPSTTAVFASTTVVITLRLSLTLRALSATIRTTLLLGSSFSRLA